MIVITKVRRQEVIDNFVTASRFIEDRWPRMSKLARYIYLCSKPPKGWRIKKAKRPDTGGYSMIGPDKDQRDIWIRTFKRTDNAGYYVLILAHELFHHFQARNLSHIQFYGRYYRSKLSRIKYEDNADRIGDLAEKLFDEHLTHTTRK